MIVSTTKAALKAGVCIWALVLTFLSKRHVPRSMEVGRCHTLRSPVRCMDLGSIRHVERRLPSGPANQTSTMSTHQWKGAEEDMIWSKGPTLSTANTATDVQTR